MNRRQLLRTLALTGLTTLAATAAGKKTDDALKVGETQRYDGKLELTFLAVRKDRRCPINAACLTQGDAVVVLRVKAGNQAPRKVRIHTDLQPRRVVIPVNRFPDGIMGIPKSHVISIASLNPLPTAGKKTPQSAYRLKLRILVAL